MGKKSFDPIDRVQLRAHSMLTIIMHSARRCKKAALSNSGQISNVLALALGGNIIPAPHGCLVCFPCSSSSEPAILISSIKTHPVLYL